MPAPTGGNEPSDLGWGDARLTLEEGIAPAGASLVNHPRWDLL